jgi:hypothetical protein
MERRCPRNTKRSNPESVPAILSWCLAINSCMRVLLRVVIGVWNEPAMIRGWGNALGLELARFRKTNGDLLNGDPELECLGTLHAHPRRMRDLSGGDRETIREALKTSEAFIADVIDPAAASSPTRCFSRHN